MVTVTQEVAAVAGVCTTTLVVTRAFGDGPEVVGWEAGGVAEDTGEHWGGVVFTE